MAAFSASQAGLLALMRSLALAGGPNGDSRQCRLHGVGGGLDPRGRPDRSPWPHPARPGRPAPTTLPTPCSSSSPPDAGHITGSTLVVDGGQSLQSWSNAPRVGQYRLPSPQAVSPHLSHRAYRRRGGTSLPGTPSPRTGAVGDGGSRGAPRTRASRTARYSSPAPRAVWAAPPRAASRPKAPGSPSSIATEPPWPSLRSNWPRRAPIALALEVDVDRRSVDSPPPSPHAEEHFGQPRRAVQQRRRGQPRPLARRDAGRPVGRGLAINLRGVFLGCKYGVPGTRCGPAAGPSSTWAPPPDGTTPSPAAPPTWPAKRPSRR